MPSKDPREPFSRITVEQGKEMMASNNVAVIDVREPHEYNAGHVPDAKLIPMLAERWYSYDHGSRRL